MMKKDIMALIGTPVRLMRNTEPMVPFLAAKSRLTVKNMAPVRNRGTNLLSIVIDGFTTADEHFGVEVIIETVYTRKQVFNMLNGSDAMYVLRMKMHVVDAYGNCKCVPHIKVRSFSRLHQNEEMSRLANGVEFH